MCEDGHGCGGQRELSRDCAFHLAVPGFPCFCLAVHSSIAGWWVVSDNSPVSGSRTAGITDGITVVLF